MKVTINIVISIIMICISCCPTLFIDKDEADDDDSHTDSFCEEDNSGGQKGHVN